MAFVMIATGATSRARVRTLSVRPLIALAGVAALGLLASGGAVGYWLAELTPRAVPTAAAAAPEPLALPFTLEQVGAMSARLFRLESEAAQLSKRIGVLHDELPPSARAPDGLDGAARAPARPAARCCRRGDASFAARRARRPARPRRAADGERGRRRRRAVAGADAAADAAADRRRRAAPRTSATASIRSRTPTRSTPASISRPASARRSLPRPAASSPSPASSTTSAGWSRSITATV